MPEMTDFRPKDHGFHFPNSFANTWFSLADLARPSDDLLGELGIRERIRSYLAANPGRDYGYTTYGRCGGMSYAALDYYHAHLNIPPDRDVPENTPLGDYIRDRLVNSLTVPTAIRFITWSLDLPPLLREGMQAVSAIARLDGLDWARDVFPGDAFRATQAESEKLCQAIRERHEPVPLGLVKKARSAGDLFLNHQVVAYGYEGDSVNGITVYLYDCNHPDNDGVTLSARPQEDSFHESWPAVPEREPEGSADWDGFFVQDYAAKDPPEYRDPDVQ